tara:strand:+ start:1011 stop:1145 length:135 start_codon:yes stop_codon:yes gene_type:complete
MKERRVIGYTSPKDLRTIKKIKKHNGIRKILNYLKPEGESFKLK